MKQRLILAAILAFALVTRLYLLETPAGYYFDEVYHAVTAKAYALNNPAGYEWWHSAPEPGTAYEWLHPPIAKLFMAVGWKYLGQTGWAWRIPGALFGVGVIYLTYWLTLLFFERKNLGLVAALLASLDGLLLSQSRIGMNDIYVTFFMLLAIGCYVRARKHSHTQSLLFSGIFAGVALSTKWSGVFVLPMIGVFELLLWISLGRKWLVRLPQLVFIFGLIPVAIYFLSFGQFWMQGHTLSQFKELHNQIWWYQTHLTATHTYQSKAWEWPFDIRPVWYYVHYLDDGRIANIYNVGNPLISWLGLAAMIITLFTIPIKSFWSKQLNPQLVVVVFYVFSWMPWLFSPRIMFYYHYTPAVPMLCIALAYQLRHLGKYGAGLVLLGVAGVFLWMLPLSIGIPVSSEHLKWLFLLPTWK